MKMFLSAVLLASLACGGGAPGSHGPGMTHEGEGEGQPAVEYGTVDVTVVPQIASTAPFQIELDGAMLHMSVVAGQMVAIPSVVAGQAHEFRVSCPGYGYTVAGQTWSTADEPVASWTMPVQVAANATLAVNATVCRDLSGNWQTLGAGIVQVNTVATEDGQCHTSGFSPTNFQVTGDTITVPPGTGSACDGLSVVITNPNQISLDCNNDGTPDWMATRQVN